MLMARLYPHIFSKEILAQRAITSQISLEQKIDDFWIAKCEIPLIPGLQEDCKIELYEVWTWEDLLVFSGFIYETRPLRKRWDMLEITARDFKAIFQKRKALTSRNWKEGVTLEKALQELLGYYNEKYQEQRTWSCFDATIKIEVKQGDTYADLFWEICEKLECYRTVTDGQVIFRKQLWKKLDTTLMYDGSASNPGNITEISSVATATACNIVLVEDSEWKKTVNADFFDGIVSGVGEVSVRNGNLEESAQLKAKKLSKRQRTYQVSIAEGSITAEVGDTLNLDVRNTNHYFNFQGEVIVQGKQISYNNATKRVSYTLGDELVYSYGFLQRQKNLTQEIRLLKLKNLT